MSKADYIAAHENAIDEMMEATGCDWQTAYEATADSAWDRMRERLADAADDTRMRSREG